MHPHARGYDRAGYARARVRARDRDHVLYSNSRMRYFNPKRQQTIGVQEEELQADLKLL